MADTYIEEPSLEEEYDEEADSDFDDHESHDGDSSASSEHGSQDESKGRHATKKSNSQQPVAGETTLDSGDEATIRQQKRSKKKAGAKDGKSEQIEDGGSSEEWRAKTRSMKAQEKEDRRQRKLVNLKTSTIDVNHVWELMNKPGPLPPLRIEGELENGNLEKEEAKDVMQNDPVPGKDKDMITIKRQYKFAGEVHIEEKSVHKSSAEAQLWLSQQEGRSKSPATGELERIRPLRKVSRFDPNFSNIAAFKNQALSAVNGESFKGPKLNVVEKSKMDWASHVDAEGLKEELDKHAKTKDAYLSRMDFLGQVEQRREDEAREARLKH